MGRSSLTTNPQVPSTVEVEAFVRSVTSELSAAYGNPRLGNPEDPLDDLIFILLSGATAAGSYEQAFLNLKELFSSWSDALAAGPDAIYLVIHRCGLGLRKARQIHSLLSHIN